MRDPDDNVRNNATRALWVIASYGRDPKHVVRVAVDPFVDLLDSLTWSDRNKASLAMMELSAGCAPACVEALRDRALPSLLEMARWTSVNHAMAPAIVLGRAAGRAENAIQTLIEKKDIGGLIGAATTALASGKKKLHR
jgi:hypothetical protein